MFHLRQVSDDQEMMTTQRGVNLLGGVGGKLASTVKRRRRRVSLDVSA